MTTMPITNVHEKPAGDEAVNERLYVPGLALDPRLIFSPPDCERMPLQTALTSHGPFRGAVFIWRITHGATPRGSVGAPVASAHDGPPAGSEAMSEIAFFDDGASDITIEVDVPIRFY